MTLRLLHLSNDVYPGKTGGTEIFVRQLIDAQQQSRQSIQILWATHQLPDDAEASALTKDLAPDQRRLPPIVKASRLSQVAATAAVIPGFQELLHTFEPEVVHLHSFSDRCGLSHARAIKASGARLVLTVHAPGFSCIKGNLIDVSGKVCDGRLLQRRCTRCRLHNGGIPRWLAGAVAVQYGWPLSTEAGGSLAHVATARQMTAAFHRAWLELCDLADAIHVLASWSREVLRNQGIPESKIRLVRTAGPAPLPQRTRQPMQDGCLRLVYWGRCNPVKGLHLVIEAIQSLPAEAPIQLDFYGPCWDSAYGQMLQQRISNDPRFRLMANLSKDRLLHLLQQYDLAVVPSTWLETGPLTVLEAFAAGLPVAGSDLGGIHELLEGVPGSFRIPLDPEAWRQQLQELITNPQRLVPPPAGGRQFIDLAEDLQNVVYRDPVIMYH